MIRMYDEANQQLNKLRAEKDEAERAQRVHKNEMSVTNEKLTTLRAKLEAAESELVCLREKAERLDVAENELRAAKVELAKLKSVRGSFTSESLYIFICL